MLKLKTGIVAILILASVSGWAQVSLNNIFDDHMVLQQNAGIKIWGKAAPGEKVTLELSFLKKGLRITADEKGNWIAGLRTPKFGGPYKMAVKGANNQIEINDIYLGEVWLASGQSNMEFPLDSSSKGYNGPVNFKEEIRNASFPMVRQYLVKDVIKRQEADDQSGEWLVCAPENAKKWSALAYFYARSLYKGLNVPIGIINAAWGGTSIGSWMRAKELASFDADAQKLQNISLPATKVNENYPSVLYNGMVNPITKYTIKGVIWNQGENSISAPLDYAERMQGLISGWRDAFQIKDMPFLYVQIAPFNYLSRSKEYFTGTALSLGYLVEQQVEALRLPHTWMARTGDVGDIRFIHYRNKQEVGRRLSLIALKNIYKLNIGLANGPDVAKISYRGSQAIVRFKNTGTGLQIKANSLNGFELSSDGLTFYPAQASLNGNEVRIVSAQVSAPKALRYCFSNIAEVNLFNSAGLPALPFRTDHVRYDKPD